MRLQFDPRVSVGNLMVVVSFLAPACVYGVTFWGRFDRVERDVQRHERLLERMQATDDVLARNQQTVALALQHVSDLLDIHLREINGSPSNGPKAK